MWLYIFIGLIIGSISGYKSYWFLFLLMIPLTLCFLQRRYWNALSCLIAAAIIAIVTWFISRPFTSGVYVGMVTRSAENYFVISTYRGGIYVQSTLNPGLGSLFRLTGEYRTLYFARVEGDFDFASYLNRRGCFNFYDGGQIECILDIPNFLSGYRSWVLSELDGDNRSLISSFLFAKGSGGISGYNHLREASLTRFLTDTSLHISFIVLLFERVLKEKNNRLLRFISPAICFIVCTLSDFSLSGKRIFLLSITRLFSSRFKESMHSRCLAGSLLILSSPFCVCDLGFYIPFMLMTSSVFMRGLGRLIPKVVRTLLKAILNFLVIVPFSIIETGKINLLAMVIPLFLVLPSCLVYCLSLPLLLIPAYGIVLEHIAGIYLSLLRLLSNFGVIRIGVFLLPFIILWYIALLVFFVAYAIGHPWRYRVLILIPLCFISLPIFSSFQRDRVVFINVGQGDSTLVVKSGKGVLIDTGGSIYRDIASECLVPFLEKEGIKRLAGVIITHEDFDHCGALEGLTRSLEVEKVIYGDEVSGSFNLGGIEFIDHNFRTDGADDNDISAVLEFEVGKNNFLIMGDAPVSVEKEIIERGADLKVDYLRIGHHGSKTSTSVELLTAVNPELAVISCGKNYYGHPDPEVVGRIAGAGIPIWRTDIDGSLKVFC